MSSPFYSNLIILYHLSHLISTHHIRHGVLTRTLSATDTYLGHSSSLWSAAERPPPSLAAQADLDTASERLPREVVAVASVARFLAASTPAQSTQSDVWASASAKRLNGLGTAHTMRFVHPNSKTKQTVRRGTCLAT